MNDEPTFDPRRKAAIRDLVVANAEAHPGRAGARKRTALVATLVVLALTISGGSVAYALGTGLLDPTPVAAPSPTPTPTVTETPTPTPTPTPTATAPLPAPSEDPADPATWILGFDQVGGVRFGESSAALAAAAKLVAVDDTIDCPPGYWSESAPDITVEISLLEDDKRGTAVQDPVLTYAAFSVRTASEEIVPASPSTEAGIRLGSTESDLMAAYPDLQKSHSRYDESMGFTTYAVGPTSGRYLVFQVATAPSGARTVIHMQSSTYDSVVDLCD
ncbi:hypothetical protein ACRAWB_15730 [Leifsonia poae]|uniref:hypothetical protein n=1 Tax=Leifsonia poae TaxID=110933 RepID=UPI003D68B404